MGLTAAILSLIYRKFSCDLKFKKEEDIQVESVGVASILIQ